MNFIETDNPHDVQPRSPELVHGLFTITSTPAAHINSYPPEITKGFDVIALHGISDVTLLYYIVFNAHMDLLIDNRFTQDFICISITFFI